MATQKQIEANRRNAALSTGPSGQGKLKSRLNATKHGLAGRSAEVANSPEFEERRAKWAAELAPADETTRWALDRAVAASFRIEGCEKALDRAIEADRQRAALAWDEDRAAEAAVLASKLARNPPVVARQLRTSLAGVEMLMEAWLDLILALRSGRDWTESETSKALDLLAVAPESRSIPSPIDAPEGSDPIAHREALALREVESLELLRNEAMIPLDDLARSQAVAGATALLAGPAKLLLRYERDAWRRYRQAMEEVRKPRALAEPEPEPTPAPPPSKPVAQPGPEPEPEPVGDVQELLASLPPDWLAAIERRRAEILAEMEASGDEEAYLAGLESRLATQRSQFEGAAMG